MKLSRHAITVLTRQYKSVLLKCALINAGLFLAVAPAMATDFNVAPGSFTAGGDAVSGTGSVSVTGLAISDTTGLQAALDSKVDATSYNTTINNINSSINNINSTLTNTYTKTETNTAITTALANGTDPYQTASDVSGSISANNSTLLGDASVTGSIANTLGGTGSQTLKQVIQGMAGTDIAVENIDTTNYSGSAMETAVGNQITTALANGSNPYQTASDVSTAVSTATTIATAGTSSAGVAVGDTVLAAIGKLDSALKTDEGNITTLQGDVAMDAASQSTAGYAAGAKVDVAVAAVDGALKTAEGEITKLTTGTDTGVLNVLEAHIGANGLSSTGNITTTGTANISAGGNLIAGGNISTTNGTISGKEGSFTGNLGVTGKTTTGSLEVTNNAEVKGNATITGTLSAGATTVNGTFGAGTGGAMFVVDADGDITKAGTIAATGITTTANSTALGGSGFNNTITGSKTTINGLTQLDAANGMKFGDGGQVVTSVDTAGIAQGGAGTAAALASTQSVVNTIKNQAQDATFTPAAGAFNVSSATTINGAITALDTAVGSRADWTKKDDDTAATVGAALTANSSLADAVSQLNVNIGTATTANDVDATKTVNQNIAAVDTALVGTQKALGAMINQSTDTYVNTALQGNGFKKATTDLTDELSSYAGNIATAFGGTFDADSGVWASGVTAKTSTSYGYVEPATVAETMDTLAQVTYNIGTAITGVDRSASLAGATTAATSTVNANINALDTAIGDLDYTGGSVNYANATGSLTDAIKTINANIGAALTGVEDRATAFKLDPANSVNENLAKLDAAIGKEVSATYNNITTATSVNANLDSLDAAIGDRSFTTTKYVAPHDDLSTAVTKLDSELHSVNHEVRKLRHDMNRGLASVAALSALVPNARGTGNTSLSVGTGHYHGQTAMALGGAHWFTDNLMVNIGVASTMGHTRDATYRAGISYSF